LSSPKAKKPVPDGTGSQLFPRQRAIYFGVCVDAVPTLVPVETNVPLVVAFLPQPTTEIDRVLTKAIIRTNTSNFFTA